MTAETALQHIREISGDPVMAETPISELGDSLDLVFLLTEMESLGKIEIPRQVVVNFNTAGDIAEWFAGHQC